MKRAIRGIGIAFFTTALIAVIISFFLPSDIRIERDEVIKADMNTVFGMVDTLNYWKDWSPWAETTEDYAIEFQGPVAGKGAGYSWQSRKRGNGRLEVTESQPGKRINCAIYFGKNAAATPVSFVFEQHGEAVKVTWAMDLHFEWTDIPQKLLASFQEDVLGPNFENGLERLKRLCEGKTNNPQ